MATHQLIVDREERVDVRSMLLAAGGRSPENSFHWTGEALNPDGHTWKLEGDFRVTRMR